MRPSQNAKNQFPAALKFARRSANLTQEAFALVSSRTYVSSIERGMKTPTLNKVDELAEVLGIHPLTLLTLAYIGKDRSKSAEELQDTVSLQLKRILDTE
jgi:transcriptional regulator with XRE-family HTH domain